MSDTILSISDLNVSFSVFGGQLKVLDGVNLDIQKGEKIGLVGEMGCGKTTTMKAVLRLLQTPPAKVNTGSILFKDQELLSMPKKAFQKIRRNHISMIFEDPTAALNPVFKIGTQLRDAVKYSENFVKKPTKKELTEGAIKALEAVSLPDPDRVLEFYPLQLSGGMRQRVCIAMALLSASDLLIADEPDTSLDVTIKAQILNLLNDLVAERNTSIILISHSLGAVRNMTNRVFVMYAGSIVESSETMSLYANPLHPYTKGLLESTPKLSGGGIGNGIPGRIPEYLNPPTGCRFHPRCVHAVTECQNKKPPFFQVDEHHKVACYLFKDNPVFHSNN
jgi:peptide/nickel transport system ATP-binding protein